VLSPSIGQPLNPPAVWAWLYILAFHPALSPPCPLGVSFTSCSGKIVPNPKYQNSLPNRQAGEINPPHHEVALQEEEEAAGL